MTILFRPQGGFGSVSYTTSRDTILGFRAFLDNLSSDRHAAPAWKLGSVFGQTYNDIHNGLKGAPFDFVRNAFCSYVQSRWEGPLARRNRHLPSNTIATHRWVSILKAAQRLNVTNALLHRMVTNGELSHRVMKFPSGRTGLVVDCSELMTRAEQLTNAMSLEEAADYLKITKCRVRQLLEAGLLWSFGGKPPPGGRWWIDGGSLTRLGTPIPCPTVTEGLVSITQLAKLELPANSGLVELIGSIQCGGIQAYFAANDDRIALGRWLVSRRSIAHKDHLGSNLSVAEAAGLIGIKQEVAYALVRSGLLVSHPIRSGRRIANCVTQEAVENFNRAYVFSPELARLNKTSPKSIPGLMSDCGILPVAGPGVMGAECRQYVWSRLDCHR